MFCLTDPAGNYRQKSVVSDICYQTEISSLMDFGTPDSSLDKGKVLPLEIWGVALVTEGSVCMVICARS